MQDLAPTTIRCLELKGEAWGGKSKGGEEGKRGEVVREGERGSYRCYVLYLCSSASEARTCQI